MKPVNCWNGEAAPPAAADRDRQLITCFRRGDDTAFEMLYQLYFDPVLRYLQGQTDDPQLAQDAAQESFIRAYRALRASDNEIRLGGWIKKIARNVLIDEWHRSGSGRKVGDEDQVEEEILSERWSSHRFPASGVPGLANQEQETVDLFWAAAELLSADQRQVLSMRLKEGLPSRQVAERLGKTVNVVDVLYSKAKQNLTEIGYARLVKKIVQHAPCMVLRDLVSRLPPGSVTAGEKALMMRHVRTCAVCQEHWQRTPWSDMFIWKWLTSFAWRRQRSGPNLLAWQGAAPRAEKSAEGQS